MGLKEWCLLHRANWIAPLAHTHPFTHVSWRSCVNLDLHFTSTFNYFLSAFIYIYKNKRTVLECCHSIWAPLAAQHTHTHTQIHKCTRRHPPPSTASSPTPSLAERVVTETTAVSRMKKLLWGCQPVCRPATGESHGSLMAFKDTHVHTRTGSATGLAPSGDERAFFASVQNSLLVLHVCPQCSEGLNNLDCWQSLVYKLDVTWSYEGKQVHAQIV